MSILTTIANISYDHKLSSLAKSYGINIMNVAWEDCARTKGSCFGPNISDMTLIVNGTNMPLMRKPNYADVSSDQDISKFNVIVGNETNSEKTMISLKEYLESIDKYTGNSNLKSMYLPRDEKILTSAQACILPLSNGEVSFNVKLYNYQSYDEPAVLILVCSSEGTSAQIVKGRECTLYFNKGGLNANYIAERLTDDRKRRGVPLEGAMTNEEKQRNALLIFQIPLIYKKRETIYASPSNYNNTNVKKSKYLYYDGDILESMGMYPPNNGLSMYGNCKGDTNYDDESSEESVGGAGGSMWEDDDWGIGDSVTRNAPIPKVEKTEMITRGFENAVIKTSDGFGKFIGTENRTLVRDDKYPIRCTIQYYKVTDTADITELMIKEIAEQVNKQYESVSDAERGSLVFGVSERKTEPTIISSKPFIFQNNESMMKTL